MLYVRGLIFALLLFLVPTIVDAQTYNYSYTDPCTGVLKTINVPTNGVTVTYFGQQHTFNPSDFTNGTFDNWANSVYSSFGGNNPCGSTIGVSSSISMAQNSAMNALGIFSSLSAISDIASINGGGLNTNGVTESSKAEGKSNKKNDKKSNSNNSTSESTTSNNNSGNTNTNTNSQSNVVSGNNTNNSGGSTSANNSGSSVNGSVSNSNSSGTSSNGSTPSSNGSSTNNNSGSSTTGNNNSGGSSSNGSTPSSNGSSTNNNSGSSTTGNNNSGGSSSSSSPGSSSNVTPNNNSSGSSSNGSGSSSNGTSSGSGTNNSGSGTNGNGGSSSSNGSGSNTNPNSNNSTSTDIATNEEKKSSNILGGSVTSIQNSSSGGSLKGNAPTIVLSSDFAGFNFKQGDVIYGGKGTAGWTAVNWDGTKSHGFLLDYTSANKGPNFTTFFANIKKRRIDLISVTGTTSFYGSRSLYGTLAIGQMWSFPKVKNLKAIYMATSSYGNVYGTKFLGTAFIAGGMYDLKLGKRTQIKFTNLFIYAPYISYYNDMVLKSPYVIMPIIGSNIGITKKFKLNVNFGGTYAIGENVLNFTFMMGTRFVL